MYQGSAAFTQGITKLLTTTWDKIFTMGVNVEGLYTQIYTFPQAIISKYIHISYFVIYASCGIAVIVSLLRGRIKENDRQRVVLVVVWTIGVGLVGFLYQAMEMWRRIYLFALVPAVYLTIRVFPNRNLSVALMLACVALILPARYAGEAFWDQVLTSQLATQRFFSYKAGPVQPYYISTGIDERLKAFYNPDLHTWPKLNVSRQSLDQIISSLDAASYVIVGRSAIAKIGISSVDAEISRWLTNGTGQGADLVYNNDNFRIYKNGSRE